MQEERYVLRNMERQEPQGEENHHNYHHHPGRVGKNPVFFKPSPVGFLGFFLDSFGLFGFFYIFAQKREFLWFFQFQEYF
jgi:hypothetical protein